MEKVVKKNDLLEYISEEIRRNPSFNNFNVSKDNKTLLCKDNFGNFRIELNTYLSYDTDRHEVSNEIIPYFYRKFNILHDWFKKHTVLRSSDYNSRASILLGGESVGIKSSYHFLVTNENFENDFQNFMDDLNKGIKLFENKFKLLENLFEYQALPIIKNVNFNFNPNSFDDYFFILKLTHIISPENFTELNERVYSHFKAQNEDEHPHAMFYYQKYEHIINELKK